MSSARSELPWVYLGVVLTAKVDFIIVIWSDKTPSGHLGDHNFFFKKNKPVVPNVMQYDPEK